MGFELVPDQPAPLAAPCRLCSRVGLEPLGTPPGFTRNPAAEAESALPDTLAWCPSCTLVQSLLTVPSPPEPARSSWRARAQVESLLQTYPLPRDAQIVEICRTAPNSLAWYQQTGRQVLAITSSPAADTAAASTQEHPEIPQISGLFTPGAALELVRQGYRAHVLHLNQVLHCVVDLNEFLAACATLLRADGILVLEGLAGDDQHGAAPPASFPGGRQWFSLTALRQLFGQHGLEMIDVLPASGSGESPRFVAAPIGTRRIQPSVLDWADNEAAWVWHPESYSPLSGGTLELRPGWRMLSTGSRWSVPTESSGDDQHAPAA